MPAIELSAETIALLQRNMRPMVDTIDSTIGAMFRDFSQLGIEYRKVADQNRAVLDELTRAKHIEERLTNTVQTLTAELETAKKTISTITGEHRRSQEAQGRLSRMLSDVRRELDEL